MPPADLIHRVSEGTEQAEEPMIYFASALKMSLYVPTPMIIPIPQHHARSIQGITYIRKAKRECNA